MIFEIDIARNCGTSSNRMYTVCVRGERYGSYLDISIYNTPTLTVWVRRYWRPVLEYERRTAGTASHVNEWVVDNGAGTGADRLITLPDKIGETTLGELLLSFAKAYQASFSLPKDVKEEFVKVACRGNQRSMMEDRYGP